MAQHSFTSKIQEILRQEFGEQSDAIFAASELIQYLNVKTRSAERGAKARNNFANLYALYILVEDYIEHGYLESGDYAQYEGANYTKLLKRQRELPFGEKLQNHALNHRMNEEFKKYFLTSDYQPILRKDGKYWINEHFLKVAITGHAYNIAQAIIKIIDAYVEAKKNAFELFIRTCEQMQSVQTQDQQAIERFIFSLLAPNVDARIFEIVSYAILKYHYHEQIIYFGFDTANLAQERLKLYKTGRTNANDVKKYFLDIDKIEKYPITFVIKSKESIDQLRKRLEDGANRQYGIKKIVEEYMGAIEEIINISRLEELLRDVATQGHISNLLGEIIKQSRVEFNYADEEIEIDEESEIEEAPPDEDFIQ
jgi:hypothetical protein